MLVISFLISCEQTVNENNHKEKGKIPGSFKSLDLLSRNRAYPNLDIPKSAYTQGYLEHVALKKQAPDLLKSNNEWEAMGPLNTSGRTLTIAVNPEAPNTIYAGSASGGLWRSRDLGRGISWEYMPTGFPVLGVSTIAFPANDSTQMYIGTGEVYNYNSTGTDGAFRSTRGSYGIGILKSNDGGLTWEKSLDWSYNQQHGVWMIKVSPTDPNIVYAATTEGVYKSIDAGENWSQVLDVIMGTDIDIDPRDPNRVVASFGNFGTLDRGIYYTIDGGSNWNKILATNWQNFQGKILIDRSQSDPDVMYASVGNGFGFNDGATWLLKSQDGGRSWSTVNNQDYSRWQGWFSHDLAISPSDPNELITVGIDIFKSENGGFSLDQKSIGGVELGTPITGVPDGPPNYSHSDHHFVMYHPDIEDLVLIANDGGVFLSFDNGETFQSANGGYQTTQFYNGFSVSHRDPNFAMGGLQDNSTSIFRGNENWQRAIGGDGSWTAINQSNDRFVFGSYQNLNILKSSDRGQTFDFNSGIDFPDDENPLFIAPFIITDDNFPVMYAGGRYFYRSDNLANSWNVGNDGRQLNGDPIFCMDVAPSDKSVVYVGTVAISDEPRVFITQDGGQTFLQSDAGFPNRIPNDIVVYPFDPAIAYVCFSGFGTNHLYKTEDFGVSWTGIGDDLPDIPTNAIAIDPVDPSIMYIGNDFGAYVSTDFGNSWDVFDVGLPDAVIVMDLKISPNDRKIWMATHGNGVYRADLISSTVSTQEITVNTDINIYPNPTANFITIDNKGDTSFEQWVLKDINGRSIRKGKNTSFDISDLSNGPYLLQIYSNNKVSTHTVIKN